MNILRQEIRKLMSLPLEKVADGVVTRFSFPEDFTGFKGHFSNNPILPGVCKIQALIVLAEVINGRAFEMKEIKEAKFFSPVSCNEEVVFEYSENASNEKEVTIKASVSCEDRKIAKMELTGHFVFKEEVVS